MKCERCKQYEETGMTTSDAWNHCKITGAEYFMIGFECDLVDENGEDNGNYEIEMQLYQDIMTEILGNSRDYGRHFCVNTHFCSAGKVSE